MFQDILLLLLGLALLVKGGDLFVGAATRIAEFMRMPRVVIGSTIVSLATTMPEMAVSVIAGARGNPGFTVGNALGSCVCNIGLILGLTAVIKRVDVHPRALRTALLTMAGLGVALFLMTLDLALQRWQGVLLLMADAARMRRPFDFLRGPHHGRRGAGGARTPRPREMSLRRIPI